MTKKYDFATCDGNAWPHVKVYDTTTGRTIATFPIERNDIHEAEGFAELLLEQLNKPT